MAQTTMRLDGRGNVGKFKVRRRGAVVRWCLGGPQEDLQAYSVKGPACPPGLQAPG